MNTKLQSPSSIGPSRFTFHVSRFTPHASRIITRLRTQDRSFAFTLIEILIAIGILGMVLTAICSAWTAILRATRVGLDAAAAVQRSRIAVRTIEDSLMCAECYAANRQLFGFVLENGTEATLSFVARLPKSFPRSGNFGDLDLRRVTFSVEQGPDSGRELVLRQMPALPGWGVLKEEKDHPLVLAKYVLPDGFKIEAQDERTGEMVDEWKDNKTNQIPKLVKITLKLGQNAYSSRQVAQEVVRYIKIPSEAVQPGWQAGVGGPGLTTPPGQPPGTPPGQLPPGSQTRPGGTIPIIPGQGPGRSLPGQPQQFQ